MLLSEVPWSNLAIGDVCISAVGTLGVITNLIPVEKATQREDNEIKIRWGNSNVSLVWHFQADKVLYVGPS